MIDETKASKSDTVVTRLPLPEVENSVVGAWHSLAAKNVHPGSPPVKAEGRNIGIGDRRTSAE